MFSDTILTGLALIADSLAGPLELETLCAAGAPLCTETLRLACVLNFLRKVSNTCIKHITINYTVWGK